jgi:O-antigen/teichoic acid export membrane protein
MASNCNQSSGTRTSGASLNKRYFFKLVSNIIGLGAGGAIQAIIPRGLGPQAYGDFSFLTSFFSLTVNSLEIGTFQAFYTKLSQRPQERTLVGFYFSFSTVMAALVFGFVMVAHGSAINRFIWPGQQITYVYLAAGWAIMIWFVQVLEGMGDAYGLTLSTEMARVAQKVMWLVWIIVLFSLQKLNLANFFLFCYINIGLVIILFLWIMGSKGYSLQGIWRFHPGQITAYAREFFKYSHPLFTFSLIGMGANIFDRWLLQVFGGSVQQGFYGLSYQIGTLCFVFSGAMTPLLTREFAIAFGQNDLGQMARLFRRYIPIFYSVAAFLSCFVAVQADKITYIIGGKGFKGAVMAVTIMAFYPMYQTYGQLSGAVFFATGQTALFRNIGILFLLAGVPITYLLVAPANKMGLDAGATGLALKLVLISIFATNVQLYFNARFLKLSFWRYVLHQFGSVGCFLTISFLVASGLNRCGALQDRFILNLVLSLVLYVATVMLIALFQPALFGLRKGDLGLLWKNLTAGKSTLFRND